MAVKELAEYLRMSKSAIYTLAQQGEIPASKIGNRWRFRKERIDGWLDKGTSAVVGQQEGKELKTRGG